MEKVYDLIIIGGGSAGLSAGIYAGRAKLETLILEKENPGGQAVNTSEVVNYPGVRRTTGPKLMREMSEHALDFGVLIKKEEIVSVDFSKEVKVVTTKHGNYHAYAIIIATGANPRKLGFLNELEFTGRGIAYCATCDGEFFSGLDIFVIGGGFAAAEEAIFLTKYGKKVTVIVREPDFTCAKTIADKVKNHPKIEVYYNTEVKEVSGEGLLNKAIFMNNQTNQTFVYEASKEDQTFGMFIFAGYVPATALFKGHLEIDDFGYLPTDESMQTNIEGVYAAGDLRPKSLRQIVTAVADGAIAATSAERYVAHLKEKLGIVSNDQPMQRTVSEKQEEIAVKQESKEDEFVSKEMKEQLLEIFSRLTKNITLVTISDQSPKAVELQQLLVELSTLSDKIQLAVYHKGDNKAVEEKINFQHSPMVAILNENNEYTGIKFSGIPGGHEMNSFILAIYNTASAGQPLDEDSKKKISNLMKPKKVQICVSLSCHYCPEVVASCQRIASLNKNIEAEMIDIALFPELKSRYKIMSVPAMIIDEQEVIFGSKTMNEILEILE